MGGGDVEVVGIGDVEVVHYEIEIEGDCGGDVWNERHRGGFGEYVESQCWKGEGAQYFE